MHNILLNIVDKKRADLAAAKKIMPLATLAEQARAAAYSSRFAKKILEASGAALIAEIKLASPTHSNLGDIKEILNRAKEYERAGADAISFITESHYFKGSVEDVPRLKRTTKLPVLQKDFVIDDYQVYQARLINSDALLFIARLVDVSKLQHLVSLANELGVEPVVEINDQADLKKALATDTRIIAVNARDLSTFKIDVGSACVLLRRIPSHYITLGFSGITSYQEVTQYVGAGARGVLVGTSLMQAEDIGTYIASLKEQARD